MILCQSSPPLPSSRALVHLISLTVLSSHVAVCLLHQLRASNKRRAAGYKTYSGMDVKCLTLNVYERE